jgi:23S rRNA pseudouridine1911/1915/1917 synthase
MLIYKDDAVAVAIKPPRVLSTDDPGGMPELVRQALGNVKADVRTVHRLDRVVSGLMVFARTAETASELSRQIREDAFEKEYLAVVHGVPEQLEGTMTDLLLRDKRERKTYVVTELGKGVQEAILDYRVLQTKEDMSLVAIQLRTGRTHQIRAQFSSRNLPLLGDRKYSLNEDECEIALWSANIGFNHPATGERLIFEKNPPEVYPWNLFEIV